MIIKKISPCDYEKYNEISSLYGTIFDSLQWSSIFGENITHYGFYEGDELVGGFYTFEGGRYLMSICSNPPFTPTIGPFFKKDIKSPVSTMDNCKKILALIADTIDDKHYAVISLSFDKTIIDMQPLIWKNFKVVPQYTYIVDLSASIDELMARMSREKRKNIAKGIKDGVVVKSINDYNVVKSLVTKTFARQNKKANASAIDKVLFNFANSTNSRAFAAFLNGVPIACEFFVYGKKTAHGLLSGYDPGNKHPSAGTMCYWESIKYAKAQGLSYFDFEGSMVPALERYFRGFGGKLTPYYRANKAKLPLEICLKFFKRRLF